MSLLTKPGCGSCVRVHEQLIPLCADTGAVLEIIDLEAPGTDPELRAEFADRLPVVLLDDEEHSCWEIDEEELRADLAI